MGVKTILVWVCVDACVCVFVCLKEKRGELKLECTVVECVFTYSSSSHALPQTGNTPLPLLRVYVACPLASVRIRVCLHLIKTRHLCVCVCMVGCFTLVFHSRLLCTLTSLSTCVCVCACVRVCLCFVCSLLNEGQLVPHSGFHTH